jgi:hypothetical protein
MMGDELDPKHLVDLLRILLEQEEALARLIAEAEKERMR